MSGKEGCSTPFRSQGWRNWAGNQRTDPARTVGARDTGDVVDAVKAAARDGLRVKAIGSGHSFTAIAVPDGVAVRAPADPALLRVDATGLATVPAGMTLRALNPLLWARGWALPNLGDIDVQTVAGAISTGTHGTGAALGGPRRPRCAALELVTADGSVVHCSPDERPRALRGRPGRARRARRRHRRRPAVPCPPSALHAVERPRAPRRGARRSTRSTADNDHFEFYWFPHTDIAADQAQQPLRRRRAEARTGGRVGGRRARRQRRVRAAPAGSAVPRPASCRRSTGSSRAGSPPPSTSTGPTASSPARAGCASWRWSTPCPGRRCADGVRRAAARRSTRHGQAVTFPVEVRVAAADDIPLSTAYGRDSAYLAVHVHRGEPYEAYFGAVEARRCAISTGGRTGASCTRATAADLRTAYPGFDEFVALRDRLDPERRVRQRLPGAGVGMKVHDLATPALLVDADALASTTSPTWPTASPAPRLRPHVKAHKTTALARRQAALGHAAFTLRHRARGGGHGRRRARRRPAAGQRGARRPPARRAGRAAARASRSRSTRPRRSPPPRPAACARCSSTSTSGCRAAGARPRTPAGSPTWRARGRARRPRRHGLRGPPHVLRRRRRTAHGRPRSAWRSCAAAHADVGGDVVSGGGTGTYAINSWVTEIQAGLLRADGHRVRRRRAAVRQALTCSPPSSR